MKKSSIALACLLATAGSAYAQSGTINFDGEVVNYTCVVSANGGAGTGDATISLPTVTSPSLSAVGSRAANTHFDITVGSAAQKCPAASVMAHWVGSGSNVDQNSGRLNNAVGGGNAQGVQIAILNDQLADIDLRNDTNSPTLDFVDGVAKLEYYGEYYGSGGLIEGLINTNVEYQLDYR